MSSTSIEDELRAEIDRLRQENAELRERLSSSLSQKQGPILAKRDADVVADVMAGMPRVAVAVKYKISHARVSQIVNKKRRIDHGHETKAQAHDEAR